MTDRYAVQAGVYDGLKQFFNEFDNKETRDLKAIVDGQKTTIEYLLKDRDEALNELGQLRDLHAVWAQEETGWLIEQTDSNNRPRWWCGSNGTNSGNIWSYDSLDAVRFAREVDATTVARVLPSPSGIAREHAWISPKKAVTP